MPFSLDDEEKRIKELEERMEHMEKNIQSYLAKTDSIYSALVGNDLDGRPGFTKRMNLVEDAVIELKDIVKSVKSSWKVTLIAFGIGFLLAALAFGWITLQQAHDAGIKLIK